MFGLFYLFMFISF